MSITAYRGETDGQNEGGAWYTLDADHAADFGTVAEYRFDVGSDYILRLNADNAPELYDAWLSPDEEFDAIEEIIDEREFEDDACYFVVILEDWEAGADCVIDLSGEAQRVEA